MNRKNLLVVLALLALVAAAAVSGALLPRRTAALPVVTVTDPAGAVAVVTPAPAAGTPGITAAPRTGAQTAEDSPRAWLLITVDNRRYQPYPLTRTGDYTIRQKQKGAANVIHVTPDSIRMASSTCDNQLCVAEGAVTLHNRGSRVLGSYIICLPNGVTLELMNAEEYQAFIGGQTL